MNMLTAKQAHECSSKRRTAEQVDEEYVFKNIKLSCSLGEFSVNDIVISERMRTILSNLGYELGRTQICWFDDTYFKQD